MLFVTCNIYVYYKEVNVAGSYKIMTYKFCDIYNELVKKE